MKIKRGNQSLDLVPVVELKTPLLADSAVKWHARIEEAEFWRSGRGWTGHGGALVKEEDFVQKAEDREANGKADKGDKQPVFCHPKDDFDVRLVPAVAEVVGEEAPGVVVVFVGKEDADTILVEGHCGGVVSPDDAEKKRAGRGHDGDVGQWPAAVVVGQRVNSLEEEGVARDSAHGIVGDTGGERSADPGWVDEEGVEAAVASLELVSRFNDWGEALMRTSSRSM